MDVKLKRKLEIAVASYLPYGVKMIQKNDWHSDDWSQYDILELDQICMTDRDWFYMGGHPPENWGSHSNYENMQFKLILKPLSDLTEHFAEVVGYGELKYLLRAIEKQDVKMHVLMELFEGHYDVFDLIKDNVAIDFNTLEK